MSVPRDVIREGLLREDALELADEAAGATGPLLLHDLMIGTHGRSYIKHGM